MDTICSSRLCYLGRSIRCMWRIGKETVNVIVHQIARQMKDSEQKPDSHK